MRPHYRLAAAAAVALGLATCGGAPAPAGAAQSLSPWLSDLDSPRPSVYRIAAAYVAQAGPAALDSLAARLPGASAALRAHVRMTVGAMLLTSVSPAEVERRPALRALAADDLAAADADARALCASRELERDIGVASDSTMRHYHALVALGGWAVPAALALTRCPEATGRTFGAKLLVELRAGGQVAALDSLVRDSAIVIQGEDEPQQRVTVSELAANFANQFPFSNHHTHANAAPSAAHEGEEYLLAVLRSDGVNEPEWRTLQRMREEAKASTAHTWDEFWQRARPVLEAAWDAPAPAPGAAH